MKWTGLNRNGMEWNEMCGNFLMSYEEMLISNIWSDGGGGGGGGGVDWEFFLPYYVTEGRLSIKISYLFIFPRFVILQLCSWSTWNFEFDSELGFFFNNISEIDFFSFIPE